MTLYRKNANMRSETAKYRTIYLIQFVENYLVLYAFMCIKNYQGIVKRVQVVIKCL